MVIEYLDEREHTLTHTCSDRFPSLSTPAKFVRDTGFSLSEYCKNETQWDNLTHSSWLELVQPLTNMMLLSTLFIAEFYNLILKSHISPVLYHEQGFLRPPGPATFRPPGFLIGGPHFVSSASQQVLYLSNIAYERKSRFNTWDCAYAAEIIAISCTTRVCTCMFWGGTFYLGSDPSCAQSWDRRPTSPLSERDLKETRWR